MTKVEVMAGPCKFKTTISAQKEGRKNVKLDIVTECPHYENLAKELTEVDAYVELLGAKGEPSVRKIVEKYSKHITCPVALAILKAVEVEAGLALGVEPWVKIEKN